MSGPPSLAVSCRGLEVEYLRWGVRTRALDGLDLEVPRGQWLMLTGPNGSGKSTLLSVLAGQNSSFGGEADLCGWSVRANRAHIAKEVLLVHQNPLAGTAPLLTVFENLYLADAEARGISWRILEAKYRELLATIGLEPQMHQTAGSLSGGQRQLLALLIAQVRGAQVLLLDEPLAALDPQNARTCLDEIRRTHQRGTTILFVTHDLDLARNCGDRVVGLAGGRLVFDSDSGGREVHRLQESWYPGASS